MQPDASQRKPCPRLLSSGSRASPSAASHSLTAKASRPVRWTDSRPSAPRTASAWPSVETSTSGKRRADRPQAGDDDQHAAAPAQRRFQQAKHAPARRCRAAAGPTPNAAIRPTAPGRCATNSATAIIQSMPSPISRQNMPSKPNGMAISAEQAHRHHPDRHDRHGQQIGDHAIGREPMEMEGGVGRGRQSCDHRRKNQRDDLAAAPQRDARAERGVGAGDIQGRPRS